MDENKLYRAMMHPKQCALSVAGAGSSGGRVVVEVQKVLEMTVVTLLPI